MTKQCTLEDLIEQDDTLDALDKAAVIEWLWAMRRNTAQRAGACELKYACPSSWNAKSSQSREGTG